MPWLRTLRWPRDGASPERPRRATHAACSLRQAHPPSSAGLTPTHPAGPAHTLLSSGSPSPDCPARAPSRQALIVTAGLPFRQGLRKAVTKAVLSPLSFDKTRGTRDTLNKPNRLQKKTVT